MPDTSSDACNRHNIAPADLSESSLALIRLSKRQITILRLIGQGLTDKEIARRLFISPATVLTHVRHLKMALGTKSRVQLVAKVIAIAGVEWIEPKIGHEEGWRLSPRQQEVLRLLAIGKKDSEISNALGVADSTTKTHVQNILLGLGVSSRLKAAIVAHQLGVVEVGA